MNDNVVLLLDGDIYAYRASAATDGRQYKVAFSSGDETTELNFKYKTDADLSAAELGATVELTFVPEPESHCCMLVKKAVESTITDVKRQGYGLSSVKTEVYLSNKGSFREKLCPSYKLARSTMRRPANLNAAKQYLVNKYGAVCKAGEYEADDMLSMRAKELQDVGIIPIICSIDKDLMQVPGLHYDFVKKAIVDVSVADGHRSFYRQLLTGDDIDGIVGIKGIGPVKAGKIVNHLTNPFDMYCAVLKEWINNIPQRPGEDRDAWLVRVVNTIKMTARMLYLVREDRQMWEEPSSLEEVV